MLHRDVGEYPLFSTPRKLKHCWHGTASDLTTGNPPGHREADEGDF
jgi:hypothetical protein